jgi:hypothetical protein
MGGNYKKNFLNIFLLGNLPYSYKSMIIVIYAITTNRSWIQILFLLNLYGN